MEAKIRDSRLNDLSVRFCVRCRASQHRLCMRNCEGVLQGDRGVCGRFWLLGCCRRRRRYRQDREAKLWADDVIHSDARNLRKSNSGDLDSSQ
jgi:hypothetical protein